MPAQLDFEKHRKLLLKMANQFHRRCYVAGAASLQVEDIYSEMCVAWCLARDNWQPEVIGPDGQVKRIPFTAYLVRGVRNHVNRWVGKEIMEANDKTELDATGAEDDGDSFHAVVADRGATNPEIAAIEADDRAHMRDLLSKEAQQYIDLLMNPPPALFKVLDAIQARKQYALERGVHAAPTMKKISAGLVFDLLGWDASLRARVTTELKAYSKMEIAING